MGRDDVNTVLDSLERKARSISAKTAELARDRDELRDLIERADQLGASHNEIVRRAQGGLSQRLVYELLVEVRDADRLGQVSREGPGWGGVLPSQALSLRSRAPPEPTGQGPPTRRAQAASRADPGASQWYRRAEGGLLWERAGGESGHAVPIPSFRDLMKTANGPLKGR
jgi:ABC-type transporter Mla subunit MlaD